MSAKNLCLFTTTLWEYCIIERVEVKGQARDP